MNVLSNPVIRAQEQSLPLCGPGSVQDLPHCPPGFNLSSRLNPAPMLGLQSGPRSTKPQRELSTEEQQELRRKINSRERKRMQDLNIAMDALREVMVPYASSPSSASSSQSHQPGAPPGRRLSKISTLVLARNYILLLGSSLQEMRRLLGEVSIGMGVNAGPVPGCCSLEGGPSSPAPVSSSSPRNPSSPQQQPPPPPPPLHHPLQLNVPCCPRAPWKPRWPQCSGALQGVQEGPCAPVESADCPDSAIPPQFPDSQSDTLKLKRISEEWT